MRVTIFARLTIAFASVAALSVALALVIVRQSIAADIEHAARERLQLAAGVAPRFLDDDLRATFGARGLDLQVARTR